MPTDQLCQAKGCTRKAHYWWPVKGRYVWLCPQCRMREQLDYMDDPVLEDETKSKAKAKADKADKVAAKEADHDGGVPDTAHADSDWKRGRPPEE